jgi:hypothetical protein
VLAKGRVGEIEKLKVNTNQGFRETYKNLKLKSRINASKTDRMRDSKTNSLLNLEKNIKLREIDSLRERNAVSQLVSKEKEPVGTAPMTPKIGL